MSKKFLNSAIWSRVGLFMALVGLVFFLAYFKESGWKATVSGVALAAGITIVIVCYSMLAAAGLWIMTFAGGKAVDNWGANGWLDAFKVVLTVLGLALFLYGLVRRRRSASAAEPEEEG